MLHIQNAFLLTFCSEQHSTRLKTSQTSNNTPNRLRLNDDSLPGARLGNVRNPKRWASTLRVPKAVVINSAKGTGELETLSMLGACAAIRRGQIRRLPTASTLNCQRMAAASPLSGAKDEATIIATCVPGNEEATTLSMVRQLHTDTFSTTLILLDRS